MDLYRAAGADAVQASSGKKKPKKKSVASKASETTGTPSVLEFYSGPEYLRWRNEMLKSKSDDSDEDIFAKKKLVVKYYKGLGTNTAKEGRDYFQNLDKHRKIFTYHDDAKGNDSSSGLVDNYLTLGDKESRQHDLIDMAFSKERVNDRRNWLTNIYEPDDFINPAKPTVSYDDFVNKELIMFSTADNLRSIPSVVDGLKPSQRKVQYSTCTCTMSVLMLLLYVCCLPGSLRLLPQEFVGGIQGGANRRIHCRADCLPSRRSLLACHYCPYGSGQGWIFAYNMYLLNFYGNFNGR